jgi:hypothetical protein
MKKFRGIWLIRGTGGTGVGLSLSQTQKRWLPFEAMPCKPDNLSIVFVITDVTGIDDSHIL